MIMDGVNDLLPNFDEIVRCSVASVLGTSCDCVEVDGATVRRLGGGRRLVTGRRGRGGAPEGADDEQVKSDCQSTTLQQLICSQAAAGSVSNCTATADCGVFTTTTEMPWGLPWWAWFLICCGICSLLGFLCLPLLGAPMMGGKKKSKSTASTEVVYEVVDVPDENVPVATNASPMATAAVPFATTAYAY